MASSRHHSSQGDGIGYKVIILQEGYSKITDDRSKANCTCTLIKGKKNIIVDTLTPWDKEIILEKLKMHNLSPDEIDYVVSTHGHSDHCGNNNLFLTAVHIMGFCISKGDMYRNHPFQQNVPYEIDEFVSVIPTPGHTLAHVSVVVRTDSGTVVVAGDAFENESDLEDEKIWIEAGSEDESKQRESRSKILEIADWIIPGHGNIFKVNKEIT